MHVLSGQRDRNIHLIQAFDINELAAEKHVLETPVLACGVRCPDSDEWLSFLFRWARLAIWRIPNHLGKYPKDEPFRASNSHTEC